MAGPTASAESAEHPQQKANSNCCARASKPSPFLRGQCVHLPKGDVNYQLLGPHDAPHAPLVVCLHGLNGSVSSFSRFSPTLVQAGFRVLAFDLYGFGLSASPGRLDIEVYVQQVAKLLEGLKVPSTEKAGKLRKFLEAMAAAGASELVLEHLVWCVNSVSEGMDMFEALTGVRPCTGGQHLGLGTHNALVSLGDGLYLEILALDPAQGGEGRWIGIDCPKKPCLATFCVRADRGLDEIARLASKHYDIGSIKDFSRENTEGKTLRWRLAADHHSLGYEKLPFQGLHDPPALCLCDQIFLLGFSMGGVIAVEFTNRFPERVERLLLVAPGGLLQRSKTPCKPLLFGCLRTRLGGCFLSLATLLAFCCSCCVKRSMKGDKLANRFELDVREPVKFKDVSLENGERFLWNFHRSVNSYLRVLRRMPLWCEDFQDSYATLAKGRTPVLFLWGDSDCTVPYSEAEHEVRKLFAPRGVSCCMLPESGHGLLLEDAVQVGHYAAAWFSDLQDPTWKNCLDHWKLQANPVASQV
eukprot:symbB.v1.2.010026.t2/scaffold650.1/size176305/5